MVVGDRRICMRIWRICDVRCVCLCAYDSPARYISFAVWCGESENLFDLSYCGLRWNVFLESNEFILAEHDRCARYEYIACYIYIVSIRTS